MADRTGIEWADATWNPIRTRNRKTGKLGWYCEHASPGCANCYSEDFNARRLGTRLPFKPGHRRDVEIFLDAKVLLQPLRWRRPRRIFLCSMTDLFGAWVDDEWIDRIFAVMALAPWHTYLVLTKRSDRMREWATEEWQPAPAQRLPIHGDEYFDVPAQQAGETRWHRINAAMDEVAVPDGPRFWTDAGDLKARGFDLPLPNVWLGVSAEDQQRADERVPDLMATPAAVRFVSAEPLLEGIDFTTLHGPPLDLEDAKGRAHWIDALTGHHGCFLGAHKVGGPEMGGLRYGKVDQVIVGCESGRDRRPCDLAAVRSIRDQCAAAGVAFFLKQLIVDGRKVGLPELDGRIWAEMPGAPA